MLTPAFIILVFLSESKVIIYSQVKCSKFVTTEPAPITMPSLDGSFTSFFPFLKDFEHLKNSFVTYSKKKKFEVTWNKYILTLFKGSDKQRKYFKLGNEKLFRWKPGHSYPRLPWTHDHLASTSQVLGLQSCSTMPSLCWVEDLTQSSCMLQL